MKPFAQPPFGLTPTASMDKQPSSPLAPITTMAAAAASSPMSGLIAPSGQTALPPTSGPAAPPVAPSWQGRAIATHKLRLLEFSAYVDQQRSGSGPGGANNGTNGADPEPGYESKHRFVHIGEDDANSVLEPIDVRQIQDKFPEKKGGLKELYEKGPQDSFFLVKFWADLNTNLSDEAGSFYGVTTT